LSDPPRPAEDFEDLYETAPCGYLSLSPDGTIVKINRTLASWLGRDAADLIGKPVHDILGFGGKIAFETHLTPLLRMKGHVDEIALDLLDSKGSKVPAIANAAERRDCAGVHLFTRITIFRAVDRRAYERNLLEARGKAEEESKAERESALLREQFIAVLGHDLRNPHAAIAAGIALLDSREQLSPKGQAILAQMKASVDRASGLIDDLLDFARGRLGGGMRVEANADAPLAPVLEQVVAEVRATDPDHRIETRIEIVPPVLCDRERLAQMASNLLANAVTHGSTDQPIRFEAKTAGGLFTLSVANGGAPIPPEVRRQLFQPFFRGAARKSRNGLGLGLFIASEIAKAHGGTLEVKSDADETRFIFSMPTHAKS